MIIKLESQTIEAESTPLVVNGTKEEEMKQKVRDLVAERPMLFNELVNALEQFYIFEDGKNEHYTSGQLSNIVAQVAEELRPEPEEEIVE